MNWITEHHRDNVCDIVWWLNGYMAASRDSFENCPFTEDHSRTLSAIANGMREEINKKEESLKENPPFSGPYSDSLETDNVKPDQSNRYSWWQ